MKLVAMIDRRGTLQPNGRHEAIREIRGGRKGRGAKIWGCTWWPWSPPSEEAMSKAEWFEIGHKQLCVADDRISDDIYRRFAADGFWSVAILERQGTTYLLIGRNANGTFHGLWHDGESAADIKWHEPNGLPIWG